MRLPKSVLLNTVNGEQPNNLPYVGATDPDMICVPDLATLRQVPWAAESVALVIHDCQNFDGSPVAMVVTLAPDSPARDDAGTDWLVGGSDPMWGDSAFAAPFHG